MQSTITFTKPTYIQQTASCVGKKEGNGNYGQYFDIVSKDAYFGQKTWEQAESAMQEQTLSLLLKKAGKTAKNVDMVFGGDLLNQCVGSNYGLVSFNIPFCGLYGACSTFAEGLILAAMAVCGGFAAHAAAVTSSHFCSSERQFRFPLDYGGQRPPTAQWTVTGAGAALLGTVGKYRVTHATIGKIVDYGVTDINNMGAAMAPAAIDTITRHFTDRKLPPDYFDVVASGDLGHYGRKIAAEQFKLRGLAFGNRYIDCGEEIFNRQTQDVHAGGSGCGCCASFFSGYLFRMLEQKKIKRVLLAATGALMSPTICFQGESIPGISHAVAIEREEEA